MSPITKYRVRIHPQGGRIDYDVPEERLFKSCNIRENRHIAAKCVFRGPNSACHVLDILSPLIMSFSDLASTMQVSIVKKHSSGTSVLKTNASSAFVAMAVHAMANSGCSHLEPLKAISDCLDYNDGIENVMYRAFTSTAYTLLKAGRTISTEECLTFMHEHAKSVDKCVRHFASVTESITTGDCVRNGFIQLIHGKMFFDVFMQSKQHDASSSANSLFSDVNPLK